MVRLVTTPAEGFEVFDAVLPAVLVAMMNQRGRLSAPLAVLAVVAEGQQTIERWRAPASPGVVFRSPLIVAAADVALAIIEAYLGTYPAVSDFYEAAIEETRATGFSFTLLGRRRFHAGIDSPNPMDRWSEERKAVNCQIQGTAADAVRLAMLKIDAAQLDRKYGCQMLLQIHDELMFECPSETAPTALAEIREIMMHPFPTDLAVPLTVSIGTGPSWNQSQSVVPMKRRSRSNRPCASAAWSNAIAVTSRFLLGSRLKDRLLSSTCDIWVSTILFCTCASSIFCRVAKCWIVM